MDIPAFPLPLGHKFGPAGYGSAMHHDGRTDHRDHMALRVWGNAFRGRMRRPRYTPTGVFDGPTQRAVAEIQKLACLPVTGLLGADEWPLPWTLEPPPATYVRPGGEHAETQARQHRANVRDYWRRASKFEIHPGTDPTAPAWFPGRPFGQREYGEHVKPVQEFFGFKPNGRYCRELAKRIRGFQRTRELPVSGVVDARTASYIQAEIEDPPPSGGGSSLL